MVGAGADADGKGSVEVGAMVCGMDGGWMDGMGGRTGWYLCCCECWIDLHCTVRAETGCCACVLAFRQQYHIQYVCTVLGRYGTPSPKH